jgi:hypothetical protein
MKSRPRVPFILHPSSLIVTLYRRGERFAAAGESSRLARLAERLDDGPPAAAATGETAVAQARGHTLWARPQQPQPSILAFNLAESSTAV